MPDLMTHVSAAYWVAQPSPLRPRMELIVAGTVLPDLLARGPGLLSQMAGHGSQAFHTPAGLIVLCALLAFLFKKEERGTAFSFLGFGAAIHLGLDALQTVPQEVTVYHWAFPFSWWGGSLDLFEADRSLTFAPYLGASVVLMEIARAKGLRSRAEEH